MRSIDEQKLDLAVRRLGGFTQPEPEVGAVSRLPWTAEDRDAREWLRAWMQELGLAVSVDPLGNLWGRWDVDADQSLVIGSHRDSVPKGGAFDGALGVLAALETVATLRRAGYRPRHNIEVVAWNDEEGARFGTTLFGSRLYVGAMTVEAVRNLSDPAGVTLEEAARKAGFDPTAMRPSRTVGRIRAYLELHIEQGPLLEREGIEIGVVSGVGGIVQRRVTLSGTRLHAAYSGTDRHDPVWVAAAGLQELRAAAAEANGDAEEARLAVTVGRLAFSSSLINVVPAGVTFTVDARSPDPRIALSALNRLEATLRRTAAPVGVEIRIDPVNDHTTLAGGGRVEEPIRFHPGLQDLIRRSAQDLGYRTRDLFSWAGHDAMALAPRVPTAMIFVPSQRGLSHTPAEFTRTADAARGANVLLNTLAAVDADW
jgi:hydantoinase/carbamoylase family amidase